MKLKARNYVARAKQSGAGRHKDRRELVDKRLTEDGPEETKATNQEELIPEYKESEDGRHGR